MQRVARLMWKRKSKKWTDIIESVCSSLNSSVHSSHGFRPRDVGIENSSTVFRRLYHKSIMKEPTVNVLKIGDTVRVSSRKLLFRKGYLQSYGDDTFTIYKVNADNPNTFSLMDRDENPIQGAYYLNELQKVPVKD